MASFSPRHDELSGFRRPIHVIASAREQSSDADADWIVLSQGRTLLT
jgi:hypothetical protein